MCPAKWASQTYLTGFWMAWVLEQIISLFCFSQHGSFPSQFICNAFPPCLGCFSHGYVDGFPSLCSGHLYPFLTEEYQCRGQQLQALQMLLEYSSYHPSQHVKDSGDCHPKHLDSHNFASLEVKRRGNFGTWISGIKLNTRYFKLTLVWAPLRCNNPGL